MTLFTARLRWLCSAVQDWLPFVALCLFLAMCFLHADSVLQGQGLTDRWWQSALAWYGVGLVCTFGWLIRFRNGMTGLWLKTLPNALLVSLSGPFAFFLGYPL